MCEQTQNKKPGISIYYDYPKQRDSFAQNTDPSNIYLFEVTNRNTRIGVKYGQS